MGSRHTVSNVNGRGFVCDVRESRSVRCCVVLDNAGVNGAGGGRSKCLGRGTAASERVNGNILWFLE